MEANKEQQKPLPAESAPSIHGHLVSVLQWPWFHLTMDVSSSNSTLV
jgi:hypothetical protein